MNSATPKQFLPLNNEMVLTRTVRRFEESPEIQEIVLVVSPDWADFVKTEIVLKENFRKVKKIVNGGAEVAAGMPVKDTIKIADENGFVTSTPDRRRVWTIQTPQVFSYAIIRAAYELIRDTDMSKITDDAMVVEAAGLTKVRLVEGAYSNIKITTPEDLKQHIWRGIEAVITRRS